MSRTMIRIMQANSALLLLCAFLVLSLVGMEISCAENQTSKAHATTVASFESHNDLRQLKMANCRTSLTTQNVTNGQHALKVEFSNPETALIELSSGARTWEWRKYGAVAVDVVDPSNEEIQVGMQLDNESPGAGSSHWSARYSGNVAPHATVSYYYGFGPSSPIAHGMRGGTPTMAGLLPFSMIPGANNPVNAEGVAGLKLSFQHDASTQSVVVDNIRLLPPFNYDGIVDRFGQYTGADWPGKVHSVRDLLAQKQQEEAEMEAHATLPDRDKYGGSASS